MTHRLARAVFCLPLLTLTACPTGGLVVGPTSPDASVDAGRATLDVGAPRDLGARVEDSGSRVDAASPDLGAARDAGAEPEPDASTPPAEVLAFPSARGAGARATGGRGGRVLRVTTLADSGPGSLREALDASGPRIITFAVSGTIELDSTLSPSDGSFTIAGQTAPAGGITLTGARRVLVFDGIDDFIVRYIRVRPRYADADAVEMLDATNYIVDHVSVSFGGDEVMSTRGTTNTLTFQRVLFAEGKTGSLFGDSNDPTRSRDMTFHHNAFYNVTHRHPNMHARGRVDHYNNLVYNWRFRWSVVLGEIELNHVNNYYERGCLTRVDGLNSFNKVFYREDHQPKLHSAGNLVMPDHLTDPDADNSGLWSWRVDVDSGPYAGARANTPLTTDYFVPQRFALLGPPATVSSALDARADVLADVGANARIDANGDVLPELDALDTYYLEGIASAGCRDYESSSQGQDFDQTAHYADFHASVSTTPLATHSYAVSSPDGIPDPWKTARGFAPTDDLTEHVWPSGYVGIEEYLNEVDR